MCLKFEQYNLDIIDFQDVYGLIELSMMNSLAGFDLLRKKINTDIRRLITHHMIVGICGYTAALKNKHKVVYYINPDIKAELSEYYDAIKVKRCLFKVLKNIKRLLPIKLYFGSESFSDVCKDEGKMQETVNLIRAYVDKHDTHKFTFSKAKNYGRKYGLNIISKDYFNDLNLKHLVFN